MRSLVTGVSGFAGGHLAAHLRERGEEVVGLVQRRGEAGEPAGVPLVEADIRDARAVARAIREAAPDRVYHLAAVTVPAESFDAPIETFAVNATGTLNVLEAARHHAAGARVLVVGSSEVYGRDPEAAGPIDETRPLRPESPYAASKAAADLLGYQYWRGYGLHVVRARPFNHTGPGQGPQFVWSGFAMQLAEAEAGRAEPLLRVGNLDVARDFTDVRDVVRAYALLLDRGAPGEVYNVCSGHASRLRDLLDLLLGQARCNVGVEVDQARVRLSDPPLIVGHPGKLRRATGWTPSMPMGRTLGDLLDWWRARLSAQSS